jgi:hypothetical protein
MKSNYGVEAVNLDSFKNNLGWQTYTVKLFKNYMPKKDLYRSKGTNIFHRYRMKTSVFYYL